MHDRRDYLRGYQMQDVVDLWGGSISVGIVAAVVAATPYWIHDALAARRRRREPSGSDTPVDVLHKLTENGRGFQLEAVREDQNAQGARPEIMLVLPFGRADAGMRWVVQRAVLLAGHAAGADDTLQAIEHLLEGPSQTAADSQRLLTAVRAALKSGAIVQRWETLPHTGPVMVPGAKHPEDQGQRVFFIA